MELTALISIAIVAAVARAPSPDAVEQQIVLLPSAHGSSGAVVVQSPDGERLLDQPYAGLDVKRSGSTTEVRWSASAVAERYGPLLAAQAPRPQSFLLYFVSGSDRQLTTASEQTLSGLQAYLGSRPSPEVTVIGHTDRSGSAEGNDALSLKRAHVVRELIRQAGIPVEDIPVFGRGAREPLASGAQEALNRRVEIHVR